jgi:hypothetical protein
MPTPAFSITRTDSRVCEGSPVPVLRDGLTLSPTRYRGYRYLFSILRVASFIVTSSQR